MPINIQYMDKNGVKHNITDLFKYDRGAGSALVTVADAHHEIHEGKAYHVAFANDITLNNIMDIQVTTGKVAPNLLLSFTCEAETEWWVYEAVTIVNTGTSLDSINVNRTSPNVAGLTVAYIINTSIADANIDTVISAATTLSYGVAIAGKGAAGENQPRPEYILKPSTSYSFRFDSTAAGWIDWQFDWYEDKEE